jgi:hypothetical protein
MDGRECRRRSPGERRLGRRFEAERVEEQVWVRVYELICPFLRAARAAAERRVPSLGAAGRKGA